MDITLFKKSLINKNPPDGISDYLRALWYDAKGNWDKAHEMVQDVESPAAFLIHAYLHKKEGDEANAIYWYRRAGKKISALSPEEEWKELVGFFLKLRTKAGAADD